MALYGIYGRHEIDTCPWNHKENAKRVIQITGSKSKIIFKPLPIDDPKVRRPDTSKAKKKL